MSNSPTHARTHVRTHALTHARTHAYTHLGHDGTPEPPEPLEPLKTTTCGATCQQGRQAVRDPDHHARARARAHAGGVWAEVRRDGRGCRSSRTPRQSVATNADPEKETGTDTDMNTSTRTHARTHTSPRKASQPIDTSHGWVRYCYRQSSQPVALAPIPFSKPQHITSQSLHLPVST